MSFEDRWKLFALAHGEAEVTGESWKILGPKTGHLQVNLHDDPRVIPLFTEAATLWSDYSTKYRVGPDEDDTPTG